MVRTADVVIIGGGIIGMSIGYHLVSLHPGLSVVLLEKNAFPGQGSTAKATGGIRCQFSTRINVLLTKASLPTFQNFKEEMGQDVGFRPHGYLFVTADPGRLAVLERNVALQNACGVPSRLVGPEEIRELNPAFRVDDLLGGAFCPWDGSASPADTLAGFQARGRERGLQVLVEHEVTAILVEGGRAKGVRTGRGDFYAGAVVNASGPWCRQVLAGIGLEIPALPYRRQVFAAAPMDGVAGDPPSPSTWTPAGTCTRNRAAPSSWAAPTRTAGRARTRWSTGAAWRP